MACSFLGMRAAPQAQEALLNAGKLHPPFSGLPKESICRSSLGGTSYTWCLGVKAAPRAREITHPKQRQSPRHLSPGLLGPPKSPKVMTSTCILHVSDSLASCHQMAQGRTSGAYQAARTRDTMPKTSAASNLREMNLKMLLRPRYL
jgi:hypothetical protein